MIARDTDYKPQANIALRSPLALGGFFLHYLRIRFQEIWNNPPPYIWRPNELETDLFITSGNAIHNEIRNNRPAIYVNVGPVSSQANVINDRAAEEWGKTRKFSYTRVNMGFSIRCESDTRGESHNIGWFVFGAIQSAKDVLRQKYHISNFGEVQLAPPQPAKKDRETYISTVNFSIIYELTWNVAPVQTYIKEMSVALDINSDADPTGYLTEIYLQNVGDTANRQYPIPLDPEPDAQE